MGSESSLTPNPRFVPSDTGIRFGISPYGEIDFNTSDSVLEISYAGSRKAEVGSFGLAVPNNEGVVIGHQSQIANVGLTPEFQMLGTADADTMFSIGRWSSNASGAVFSFLKSRNSVIGSNTVVQDGDTIGRILGTVDDGTDFASQATEIRFLTDGSQGANDSPGAIAFRTTASGAAQTTEALRIDSLQRVQVSSGLTDIDSDIPSNANFIVAGGGADGGGIVSLFNSDSSFSDGETAGELNWVINDGSSNAAGRVARILVAADGQDALANDVPTRMQFFTNPDGSAAGSEVEAMRIDSAQAVYIGEASNSNMTVGLTINQGANDNQILAFKSSDISHGGIGGIESDTFGRFQKANATLGGMYVSGYAEDGAITSVLNLESHGGTADTVKTTAARGLFDFFAREHDGASNAANITADGNIFAVRARVGGSNVTRFLIDEDGDMYSVTAGQTFDDYDDLALIDTYDLSRSGVLKEKVKASFGVAMEMDESTLIDAGIIGAPVKDGGLTNWTQLTRVLTGGMRQMSQKHLSLVDQVNQLSDQLESVNNKLAALTA